MRMEVQTYVLSRTVARTVPFVLCCQTDILLSVIHCTYPFTGQQSRLFDSHGVCTPISLRLRCGRVSADSITQRAQNVGAITCWPVSFSRVRIASRSTARNLSLSLCFRNSVECIRHLVFGLYALGARYNTTTIVIYWQVFPFTVINGFYMFMGRVLVCCRQCGGLVSRAAWVLYPLREKLLLCRHSLLARRTQTSRWSACYYSEQNRCQTSGPVCSYITGVCRDIGTQGCLTYKKRVACSYWFGHQTPTKHA